MVRMKTPGPTITGHEIVGTVVKAGPKSEHKVGESVSVVRLGLAEVVLGARTSLKTSESLSPNTLTTKNLTRMPQLPQISERFLVSP